MQTSVLQNIGRCWYGPTKPNVKFLVLGEDNTLKVKWENNTIQIILIIKNFNNYKFWRMTFLKVFNANAL